MCIIGSVSLYAQNQASGEDNSAAQNQVTESTVIPSENSLLLDVPATETRSNTAGQVWNWIKMILVLALVVACIYFMMNFFRKSINGGADTADPFLRKVAQLSVAPGKSIQIVTLLEKAFLIGVADNNITLLAEIEDKELVDAMNLNADRNAKTSKARNFNDVLSIFLRSKSATTTQAESDDIYKDAASNLKDFINTQTKRVRKTKK